MSLAKSTGSAKRRSSGKEELAFLPAALEIAETPPSPVGRAIAATIITVFSVALAWACLGRIDVVATATGKIVPSGRTKVVQPFETGVIRAIHVQDGQSVKAGELLIELDPTINEAESAHFRSDLLTAQLDVARLNAVLSEDANPVTLFQPPETASVALVTMQRRFLLQQVEEQRAKLAALDRQKAQKQAELATVRASVTKLEAMLPILKQRVDIRQTLYSHETGSKANYLEIFQSYVEAQHELEVQRSRLGEAEAAIAALAETRAQTAAEFRRTQFADLVEAERKAAGFREDLIKATQRTHLQALAAPIVGTVQQLAVHTIGGVVTPAQALLVLVPSDSHLEVEAMLLNRDIGFIRPGNEVEIKIDTFPFTRYGLIHGRVLSVSQDAITRDKPADKTTDTSPGAASSSSEPKGQELIYSARISLDRTQMQIDDSLVNLSAGMAVTVEIKTGTRAPITYLLSPLLRYKHESLRER
jgi:hemolysin D